MTIIQGHLKECVCDIALYHQFFDSKKLKTKLLESGTVRKVFDIYPPSSKKKDILRLIFCKSFLKKEVRIENRSYDYFLFAQLDTNASLALYSGLNYKMTSIFDDGNFNYCGQSIYDFVNWKRRGLLKFFHPTRKYFNLNRNYAYLPEISTTIVPEKIQIPYPDFKILDDIFEYRLNDIYKKRIVYFDQKKEIPYKKEFDSNVATVLSHFSENTIIRIHPRMKQSYFKNFTLDKGINIWELECPHQISDEHILISIYSTAMFTPVMITHRSPYLIFLYRLSQGIYNEEDIAGFDKHVRRFMKLYKKEKLFVPDSWEEFATIIKKLSQKIK